MVELKGEQLAFVQDPGRGFNRSMVELKESFAAVVVVTCAGFNRSMVELKGGRATCGRRAGTPLQSVYGRIERRLQDELNAEHKALQSVYGRIERDQT